MAQYNNTASGVKTDEVIITPTGGKSVVVNIVRIVNPADSGAPASLKVGGVSLITVSPGAGSTRGLSLVFGFVGGVDETVTRTCPNGVTYTIQHEEV